MLRKFIVDAVAPSAFFTPEGLVLAQELHDKFTSLFSVVNEGHIPATSTSRELLENSTFLLSEIIRHNSLPKTNIEEEIKEMGKGLFPIELKVFSNNNYLYVEDDLSFTIANHMVDVAFRFNDGTHLTPQLKRIMAVFISSEELLLGHHRFKAIHLNMMEKYKFEKQSVKQSRQITELIETHKKIAKDLEGILEKRLNFPSVYEIEMLKVLDAAKDLQYIGLEISEGFIEVDKSYQLVKIPKQMNSKLDYFSQLLQFELDINQQLNDQNLPLVYTVSNYLVKLNTESNRAALIQALTDQLQQYITILTDYKAGKGKWLSPHVKKKVIAETLISTLQDNIPKAGMDSLTNILFNIYRAIRKAITEHDKLCIPTKSESKPSLGGFVEILDQIKKDFFTFVTSRISEENDLAIQPLLEKHRLQMDILINKVKPACLRLSSPSH